jgi:hypothetical protein
VVRALIDARGEGLGHFYPSLRGTKPPSDGVLEGEHHKLSHKIRTVASHFFRILLFLLPYILGFSLAIYQYCSHWELVTVKNSELTAFVRRPSRDPSSAIYQVEQFEGPIRTSKLHPYQSSPT